MHRSGIASSPSTEYLNIFSNMKSINLVVQVFLLQYFITREDKNYRFLNQRPSSISYAKKRDRRIIPNEIVLIHSFVNFLYTMLTQSCTKDNKYSAYREICKNNSRSHKDEHRLHHCDDTDSYSDCMKKHFSSKKTFVPRENRACYELQLFR